VNFIDEILVLEDWEIIEITFSYPSKNQAIISVTQCLMCL